MTRADMLRERRRWPAAMRLEWAERAAIMEYEGGLPREEAEREAHLTVLLFSVRAGDVRPAA